MKLPYLAPLAALGVMAVGLAGHIANGAIYSGLYAREMIEALSSPALYLGSAIAASAATTMALMLTMLGLVRRADTEFDQSMYRQVYRISLLSAWLLGGSVVMLLFMTMPIGEFDEVPSVWYPTLYKVMYWMVVVLSAMLVAMVTLLFSTIRTLIANITPHDDV
jgi:mannose/fructose/N-acetylgalactosamine-specific phosphotransferase system component IIC